MREFTHSLTIAAQPGAVLDAFFDPDALAAWWHVARSVCVARSLGVYAVEWAPTEFKDEILGRLGGTFRGTVVEFTSGKELFVADAYWLPPEGDPIGPMAFEVTCTPQGDGTLLHVRQSGFEDSPRWTRYYEVIGVGLATALGELKKHVESRPGPKTEDQKPKTQD
jgi:uncharacterized protein YndB with AHSA1/START domain